jgi:hypothetical protein
VNGVVHQQITIGYAPAYKPVLGDHGYFAEYVMSTTSKIERTRRCDGDEQHAQNRK